MHLPTGCFVLAHSFLEWHEQLALMLTSRHATAVLPHPYIAMAQRHYRVQDGVRLPRASATRMLETARRRGCELVELAIMCNRPALRQLQAPSYMDMPKIQRQGFMQHSGADFGGGERVREAHADVLRAVTWSQFALLQGAVECTRTLNCLEDIAVTDYTRYSQLVESGLVLHADTQAEDIAMRTRLPQGYVYFFVCVLDFLGGDPGSISLAAERFVEFQASKNITYTEVRYAPSTLAFSPKYKFKITPAEAVDAVTKGLQRGLAAHPGLEVYQILCVDRHLGPEPCLATADLAKARGGDGSPARVVAMDLAGNESAFPNDPFVPCFQKAHAMGVNATIHAGEMPDTQPESVYQAVVDMKAKRIGHGYAAARNATVVAMLRERGIFIEACPSTCLNEYGAVGKPCPIAKFNSVGMSNFGINTDDPSLWETNLPEEEIKAHAKLGISDADIWDGYARAYSARFS